MSLIENLTNYVGPAIYRAGRQNTPLYCNYDGHGYCWWELRPAAGDGLGMGVTALALSRLLLSWEKQQLISEAATACYLMACGAGAVSTFITSSWLTAEIPFSDYGASLIEKNKCSLTGLDVAAVGLLALGLFCEFVSKISPSRIVPVAPQPAPVVQAQVAPVVPKVAPAVLNESNGPSRIQKAGRDVLKQLTVLVEAETK